MGTARLIAITGIIVIITDVPWAAGVPATNECGNEGRGRVARPGATFILETYVTKELAPTLGKGDVVIMDKLAAHKSKADEKAIKARGARILLMPPYSPDLNPIDSSSPRKSGSMRRSSLGILQARKDRRFARSPARGHRRIWIQLSVRRAKSRLRLFLGVRERHLKCALRLALRLVPRQPQPILLAYRFNAKFGRFGEF
jgi:transposase